MKSIAKPDVQDENFAELLVSTDTHHVEMDIVNEADGSISIRRTVSVKAYRANDRYIVWCNVVARIEKPQVRAFSMDVVDAYAYSVATK
jgi:hypothetical protein